MCVSWVINQWFSSGGRYRGVDVSVYRCTDRRFGMLGKTSPEGLGFESMVSARSWLCGYDGRESN